MKKILLLCLFAPLWFSSCLFEDKDLFDRSATERMEARLQESRAVLKSASNGWVMSYYPSPTQEFGGYTLFVRFGDHDQVEVASEVGGDATQTHSSLYEVISGEGPVLTFNTGNPFIHYFAIAPNPDDIGTSDMGMQGDYEFIILDAQPERVVLKGRKTGNRIILTPIAAGVDWKALMQQYITATNEMKFKLCTYTTPNGLRASASRTYRTLTFTYTVGGEEVATTAAFRYTPAGIQFYKALDIGGVEVTDMNFVSGAAPYFIDAGGSGARLSVRILNPNEHLLMGEWFFTYSGLGPYGKAEWTAVKNNLNPIYKLAFAWMGPDLLDYGQHGFNFQLVDTTTYDRLYGFYGFTHQLVGTDQIKFTHNGVRLVNAAASVLFRYATPVATINCTSCPAKTFTVTVDNNADPAWIQLVDTGNANNTIRLTITETSLPYDH